MSKKTISSSAPAIFAELEGGGRLHYPWWSPKFWHGMGVLVWASLLLDNRVAASPSRLVVLFSITMLSGINSALRVLCDAIYRKELTRTDPPDDPVFIIGHWRSGTTFLHELMMLDERFATPSTYQCFAPGHFLLTESFFLSFGGWLLPDRRPIDNVKAGWDRPQEDEFALMNLGAPSPYRRIAFPGKAPTHPEALDVSQLTPKDAKRWKIAMISFLKRLHVRDKRRFVLKSPTHTARISTLTQLFPNCKFIHITRSPYKIFPSTKRLWQALHQTQSLQRRSDPKVDCYIFNCFAEMRKAFLRDRHFLKADQIHEVRYEDLVWNPVETLRVIYRKLDLGDFAPMEATISRYQKDSVEYRTNRYAPSPQLKIAISNAWRDYFLEYHYSFETGDPL